jgi:hypothetical protein
MRARQRALPQTAYKPYTVPVKRHILCGRGDVSVARPQGSLQGINTSEPAAELNHKSG